jgi:hypothetical protein
MNLVGVFASLIFLIANIIAVPLWLITAYHYARFRTSVRPSFSFSSVELDEAANLSYALTKKWALRAAVCSIVMVVAISIMLLSGGWHTT